MWKVIGEGANTQIYETDNGQLRYEEAKAIAIKQIEGCLTPLTQRLNDVKNDLYETKGKKPVFKAWRNDRGSRSTLVIAKTKKRAMELTWDSRNSFDAYFLPVEGHWWYEYAQEEGVWEQEKRPWGEKAVYQRKMQNEYVYQENLKLKEN